MNSPSAVSRFAAPVRPACPWPSGAIVVPDGPVRVQAGERLLVHSGLVIGVVLPERAVMLCLARRGSRDDLVLLEQVAGFLHAYDYHLVRLRIRFPLRWALRARSRSFFRWKRCAVHWTRAFLADRSQACRLTMPSHVLVPEAIRESLRAGAGFWLDTLAILRGLERADPELLLSVAPEVVRVARWWEIHVARMARRAELEGWFAQGDRELVAQSDRYWNLCARFIPGYEMLPQTTVRLL